MSVPPTGPSADPSPSPAAGPPGGGPADRQQPVFATVEEWLQWFLEVFRRPQGGTLCWCPKWYLHAEAVIRLTVLWLTWETARTEPPSAMSAWLRDDLDYHFSVLTDPRGPFYQCTIEGGHIEPKPFPSDTADVPFAPGSEPGAAAEAA